MNKKKNSKQVFKKDYFKEYYHDLTGDFEQKDLVRNKNWFYGWFNQLQQMYDFKNGKGKKVLEIGCAIGAAADLLSERGFKVTATDISPYAVKNAKKLLPHVTFNVLDIDEPPKKKNEYDLVYSFEVIEHLPDPEKSIKHMYEMLKEGGVMIASTPYPYNYVYIDKTHINVRYPLEWIDVMRRVGFKKIKFMQKGFIPYFYRFSKYFHIVLPFGVETPYINSPIFLYGEK